MPISGTPRRGLLIMWSWYLGGSVAGAVQVPGESGVSPRVQPTERRVTIVSDGWRLIGELTLPGGRGRAPAVLLLSGAGSDRQAYRRLSATLAARGIGSLRLDSRAMGESINRGRFIPFDSTGHNGSLGLDRDWADVRAALRFLEREPRVDRSRIGAVGASMSGEALAKAIRGRTSPRAVIYLSPGSFSDSSLADVDRIGRRTTFVYSAREMIVRRFDKARWTRRGTSTARVIMVPDSAHATGLLAASPLLVERLAEWLTRALAVEPADSRWRHAADRVAPVVMNRLDDLERPGEETASLGQGAAGRLRFLVAWYRARRDAASLHAVGEAADRLIELTSSVASDSVDVSLYLGLAGPATALLDAADATEDDRHRRHAVALFDRIRNVARPDGDGLTWGPANDVAFGDAGIALALFAAGRRLGDSTYLGAAAASGRTLLRRSRPDSGGRNWFRSERPPHYVLPNFSHGAAGIGTALSILGRGPDGPAEFGAAAAGAERYLLSIARRDEGGFRVPYGWPVPAGGWGRPFDIGWAHGQAGTARLFWERWRITRDPASLALVREAVAGLDSAGLYGAPAPGYGANRFGVDFRFGLAGVADFLADLYDETGDRQYLDRALRLAEEIVARADPNPERLAWTVPRWAFMPDPGRPAVFTSFFHGAAGPGLVFLKLEALLTGRRPPGSLPDSPFGEW